MRKKKLLEVMSDIDEQFIAEAAPRSRKSAPRRIKPALIAAIITAITLFIGLWLFIPYRIVPKSISQYVDSEYYEIIAQLNSLNGTPVFNNNFEKITYHLSEATEKYQYFITNITNQGDFMEGTDDVVPPPPDNAGKDEIDNSYNETTDNQVDGVIEGDLFKRSDRHIFYLSENVLYVYSIEGEASQLVNTFDFSNIVEENLHGNLSIDEMFLSQDAKTLTVIADGYNWDLDYTNVISIDVSSPAEALPVKNTLSLTGLYMSARLIDGDFLLVTKFYAKHNFGFYDESDYLPQIDTGDGLKSVSADSIVCPDNITNSYYTVICRIDEDTLTLKDNISLLSYTQKIYVSENNIYTSRSFEKTENHIVYQLNTSLSEVICISHKDGKLTELGSFTVEGYPKDQYSFDERDGIIRLVTTTSKFKYSLNDSFSAMISSGQSTSANLYCVDLNTMKIVSEVIGFAPEGETVRSVRFEGNAAYVCTAIQLTDPVFFFDLSDIHNITYKETGTIEGFSSSLIDLGDGYLLGIGYGSSRSDLKIEIYKESDSGVVSVCKYEQKDVFFSELYKSYYVNRDEDMIGLGLEKVSLHEHKNLYVLLQFDGNELIERLNVDLGGWNEYKRAALIDGYFYMLGGNDFKVEKIS